MEPQFTKRIALDSYWRNPWHSPKVPPVQWDLDTKKSTFFKWEVEWPIQTGGKYHLCCYRGINSEHIQWKRREFVPVSLKSVMIREKKTKCHAPSRELTNMIGRWIWRRNDRRFKNEKGLGNDWTYKRKREKLERRKGNGKKRKKMEWRKGNGRRKMWRTRIWEKVAYLVQLMAAAFRLVHLIHGGVSLENARVVLIDIEQCRRGEDLVQINFWMPCHDFRTEKDVAIAVQDALHISRHGEHVAPPEPGPLQQQRARSNDIIPWNRQRTNKYNAHRQQPINS